MSDALTDHELHWLLQVATERPGSLGVWAPEIRRAVAELRDLREVVRRYLDEGDAIRGVGDV